MNNVNRTFNKYYRLITSITVIVLVMSGAYFGYKEYINNNILRSRSTESIYVREKEIGDNASYLIAEILKPNKGLLLSSSMQILNINMNNNSQTKEFLINRSFGFTLIDGFYFGRQRDGYHISAQKLKLPASYDPRLRPWYILAIKNKKISVTNPYIDANTGKYCITFANPIYKNGTLMGVMGMDIFIDSIRNLFKGFEYSQQANLYMINKDGLILYSHDNTKLGSNINSLLKISKKNYDSISEGDSNSKLKKTQAYYNLEDKDGNLNKAYVCSIPGYDWKIISLIDVKAGSVDNLIHQMSITNFSVIVNPIFFFILLILIVFILQGYFVRWQLKLTINQDTLTELPNRFKLENVISKIINKSNKEMKSALILVDIDNFKFYNDTIGQTNADKIIIALAQFIKLNTDKGELLFRVGGDEFAVVVKDTTFENAKNIGEKYTKLIAKSPICINNKYYDLTVSTGITVFDSKSSIERIFSYADTALLTAKDEGKNRVALMFPELDINSNEILDFDIYNDTIILIKNAIKENQFILHFQPIMKLCNSDVSHYEALIRLTGNNGELYLPSVFIPVAEKFGLISSIDRWVFCNVLNILKVYPEITIFINLSAISLADYSLLEYFEKSILESGFTPKNLRLGIEITETAATKNFERAEIWIKKFKELGCLISIDDFGVGYTSFSYLNSLPVDFVKIDGSFIRNIDTNADHRAIVQAIHTVVKTLGKKSIAEFVESDAIMTIIRDMEITYGQGYYIGKPSPLDKFL